MHTYARIDNSSGINLVVEIIQGVLWGDNQYERNPDGSFNYDVIIYHAEDEIPIALRFPKWFVDTLIDITGQPVPEYLWVYDAEAGTFGPYIPPPPTPEQILRANQIAQADLNQQAALVMTPILVSLQLGDATDTETMRAKSWQAYYRALQAVDLTVVSPSWPLRPEV